MLTRALTFLRTRPRWQQAALVLLALLAAIAAAWALRSVVIGVAAALSALVGRSLLGPPAAPVREARALGNAEGQAAALADNLHGEAADLRRAEAQAERRDAELDAAREARADAAAAAVPVAHSPGWTRPPGYDR